MVTGAADETPDTGIGAGAAAGRPAVFFDGSCPLCAVEIATYRKCRGADGIDWVDVSGAEPAKDDTGGTREMIAPGLARAAAMRRFHVRRADGKIVSGGAAFAELWSALPAFSRAGRVGRLPGIALLLEGVYRAFLSVRPVLQKMLRRRQQGRQR
jgi:predicted DCC family thiol-disulfide oxidoreductase YuxK